MIHYTIASRNPAAHYFDVTLDIPAPQPAGQVVRLPAWIPGSYMIRDFARNIVSIAATRDGQALELRQLDKSSWQLAPGDKPVQLNYRVYAWDLSVRGAHLDTTHGFFNGTSVFLEVVGQGDQPCEVMIHRPVDDSCTQWRLATTLPRKQATSLEDFSFGLFQAPDYATLIDHPVEMGDFEQLDFEAGGIRHDVILSGKFSCDGVRLKKDLSRICQQHIRMFDTPAPMTRYMFLVMVVGEGYGGLEHRDSTSLLCSRNDLPHPARPALTDQYRSFLGLCSHEYFHSWNVKRIKPRVFAEPDLSTEVYTPLLWAFEGITSYYDDLALLRCGCITQQDYLQLLAQTMTRVQRNPGRLRQSVAESSFNAWTRFYKQDENAANAIVSYYAKGSLVALCIDLKIRQLTAQRKSLDDVMRKLWADYQDGRRGVDEFSIQQAVNEIAGTDLDDFLHQLVYQATELPLQALLDTVSLRMELRAASGQQDKGGKESETQPIGYLGASVAIQGAELKVQSVVENGPAQHGGLSAGDSLVAINGLRCDLAGYESWLNVSGPGTCHELVAFRRDELMTFSVTLKEPPRDTVMLQVVDAENPALLAWLQPASSA